MILSGKEIDRLISAGQIKIEPYNKEQLNPNSYNVKLHKTIGMYTNYHLDAAWQHKAEFFDLTSQGYELQPGRLYLARTEEYTETHGLVPMLEGRSSVGRLGCFIHVTAGFGDIGFCGFWTLEIVVVQPFKIYPGMEIGQLFYHTVQGDASMTYKSGKYQKNTGIQVSGLWKEREKWGVIPTDKT